MPPIRRRAAQAAPAAIAAASAGSRRYGDRPNNGADAAGDGVAAGENAAVGRAMPDRDHPFGIRRGVVGAFERLPHVARDRPGDEQHVGMTGRRDEAQAEALKIVEGVVECVDFKLAAVAGAGIDLADCQAAAEPAPRRALDARRQFGKRGAIRCRRRFGQRPAGEAFQQCSAHKSPF